MIYLYVKTHKHGLKYFGKTTAKDPHAYKGSGKYWKEYCDMHGYDYVTDIIAEFDNEDNARDFALRYSLDNNIVEDDTWANLKLEILDGGFDYINANKSIFVEKTKNTINNWSEEKRLLVNNKKKHIGTENGMHGVDRSGENNPRYGAIVLQSTRNKISKANKGKVRSEQYKKEQSLRIKQNWVDGKFNNRKPREDLASMSDAVRGTFWWNNNIEQRRSKICPGDGWHRGRLKRDK